MVWLQIEKQKVYAMNNHMLEHNGKTAKSNLI